MSARRIYETEAGFCIAQGATWLRGLYADPVTAEIASFLDDDVRLELARRVCCGPGRAVN